MKKTERVLLILFAVGIFLEITKVATGTFLFFLFSAALSVFYLLFSFALFNDIGFSELTKRSSYKNRSLVNWLLSIVSGVFISLVVFSTFLILKFIPDSDYLQLTGVAGIVLVLILLHFLKADALMAKSLKKTIAGFVVLALVVSFIPTNVLLKIKYPNHPEYRKAYLEYYQHPQDSTKLEKVLSLQKMMYAPAKDEKPEP